MKMKCSKCLYDSRRLQITTILCKFCHGTNEIDNALTYFFKKFSIIFTFISLLFCFMLYSKIIIGENLLTSIGVYLFLAVLIASIFSGFLTLLREELISLYYE